MNKQKNIDLDNLNIEIPKDLENEIQYLQITLNYKILLKIKEQVFETFIEFKTEGKANQIFDWEKTVDNMISKLKEGHINENITNKINILFIEKHEKIKDFIISIPKKKRFNDKDNPTEGKSHDLYDIYDTSIILSVSESIKKHNGQVRSKGVIISLSEPFKLVKSCYAVCDCGKVKIDSEYEIPLFDIPKINSMSCYDCKSELDIKLDYVNAITVELQDDERFNDIEKMTCILMNTDMEKIRAGERVVITGDIHIIPNSRSKNYHHLIPVLFSYDQIEYTINNQIVIDKKDIDAIRKFAALKGESVLNGLVEMFDRSIIGLNLAKKCLLISIASSGDDLIDIIGNRNRRKRIHVLLLGSPGLAKSSLLKKAIKFVKNSRYESSQHASGKSLTAIVDKEKEGRSLKLGPIPLAKGSVCALNEIGTMNFVEQDFLLDIMEEGEFTINKYGINATIKSPTTIIASANIINSGNSNNEDSDSIQPSQIPLTRPILDRFDLVIVFKENKNEQDVEQYVAKKTVLLTSKIPNYDIFMQKYLEYSRNINPILNLESMNLIKEFYLNLKKSNPTFGSNRAFETIVRMCIAVSRLKLKDKVDVLDVKEALEIYNMVIFKFINNIVPIPRDPAIYTVEKCSKVLEDSGYQWLFEDLIDDVCSKDDYIKRYLLGQYADTVDRKKLRMQDNRKVRHIYDLLLKDSSIRIVNKKPLTLLKQPFRINKPTNSAMSYTSYRS